MNPPTSPKKSLGQHFLKNAEALDLIVRSLSHRAGETVVEIGPGQGALTEPILASAPHRLIAIEKDEALAAELRAKLSGGNPSISIIGEDALKALPPVVASLNGAPYRIVGNIPYYITGKLLRTIGDLEHKPLLTILMVQKEVAERAASLPPRMNRLSAMIGAWAAARTIAIVPRSDFDPAPDVDSAILELAPREDSLKGTPLREYQESARLLFQQPRKTIANNLSSGYAISKEEAARRIAPFGLSGNERPGDLPIAAIRQIASEFSTHASS